MGLKPPSNASSPPAGLNLASSSLDPADEDSLPDPHWPSKFRWSAKPNSAVSANVALSPSDREENKSGSITPNISASPLKALSPGDARSPLALSSTTLYIANLSATAATGGDPPPPIVLSDVLALTPAESSKDGTISTPSAIPPSCQGAWAQPIKISSSSSLNTTIRVVDGDRAVELSSPEMWPSLLESQKGKAIR